jgi:UDP-N-acetylglucosamine:LPS N-acetylglucosamine transferase
MKICLACSHGGHLTETLQLLDAFEEHDFFFATYHSARDAFVQGLARAYFTENIGVNVMRMLRATFWAWKVLLQERPHVIVSLGAEIAIPFFYLGRLMGIKTIFVESWCRVEDLSRTGWLVYPIADAFWVQWPQLLESCGAKAAYQGGVI